MEAMETNRVIVIFHLVLEWNGQYVTTQTWNTKHRVNSFIVLHPQNSGLFSLMSSNLISHLRCIMHSNFWVKKSKEKLQLQPLNFQQVVWYDLTSTITLSGFHNKIPTLQFIQSVNFFLPLSSYALLVCIFSIGLFFISWSYTLTSFSNPPMFLHFSHFFLKQLC